MPSPNNNQINKTLRYSFWDGMFCNAMIGFTQEYFTPFLLLLGATVRHIGLLSALPNLFASLIQLKSADWVEKFGSRKKVITFFVFIQAVMLLPMAFMALKAIKNPNLFLTIVILFTSFGSFVVPAWGSLMSDLVPEDKRGTYFGWRNEVLGFVLVTTGFLAAFILYTMKAINTFYGFTFLFGMAFLFRIVSWLFLKKMYEPPFTYNEEAHFTFINFLGRTKESNFAKFVLFVAMMNFSVNLAAPFFSVLMLRDFKFNYLLYITLTLSSTLTIYLMMRRWGTHADKVGNLKIIKFTAPLIGFIPLLWVINQKPGFLFFAEIFSGFVWAGFNLCASNFIYDAVTPPKRTRCIAYFNVINGAALCLGALVGAFLIEKLPPFLGYKILSLFIISATLRFFVGAIMPYMLKEVRPVEKISNNQLFFSIIGVKPFIESERKTIRF
ncbi:MAG: MFS transporter [Candidatus Omnitrophica bacterium]|nr:MFS transporter [Candidatus Omnitrophota bacterium]